MTPKPSQLITTALVLAGPAVAIFVILIVADGLGAATGIVASLVTIAAAAAMALRPLARLRDLENRIDRLIDRAPDTLPDTAPPHEGGPGQVSPS